MLQSLLTHYPQVVAVFDYLRDDITADALDEIVNGVYEDLQEIALYVPSFRGAAALWLESCNFHPSSAIKTC